MPLLREKNSRSIFFASEKTSQNEESDSTSSDKESEPAKDTVYFPQNRKHIFKATERPPSSEESGDAYSKDEDWSDSIKSSRLQSTSPSSKPAYTSKTPTPRRQTENRTGPVLQTRSGVQKRSTASSATGKIAAVAKKKATQPPTKPQPVKLPTAEGTPHRKPAQNAKAPRNQTKEQLPQKQTANELNSSQTLVQNNKKQTTNVKSRESHLSTDFAESPTSSRQPPSGKEGSPSPWNGSKIRCDARSPRGQDRCSSSDSGRSIQLPTIDLTVIGHKISTPECLSPPTDYSTPASPISSLSSISPLTSEDTSRVHFPQLVSRHISPGDTRPLPKAPKEEVKLPHIPAPPSAAQPVNPRTKKVRKAKKSRKGDQGKEAEDTSILALYKQMKKQMYSIY